MEKFLRGPTCATLWNKALSNKWGRLSQGKIHGVKATDTIDFIPHHQLPCNQPVPYTSFVCDHWSLKAEKWRVQLVVGGDKLIYDSDSGSPATNLTETNILINSVISDAKHGAQFLSCDLKDFFLATLMEKPEYMKVNLKFSRQAYKKRTD